MSIEKNSMAPGDDSSSVDTVLITWLPGGVLVSFKQHSTPYTVPALSPCTTGQGKGWWKHGC